jgi:hypothetical protein
MLTIMEGSPLKFDPQNKKPRSLIVACGLAWIFQVALNRLFLAPSCRSRYPCKPVVSRERKAWSKSCHKKAILSPVAPTDLRSLDYPLFRPQNPAYCKELATLEKALFAFDPINRTVPTTRTRITANITAYSAMSCPDSSDHSLRISLDITLLQDGISSL